MNAVNAPSTAEPAKGVRRVVFIANSMYSEILSGGDIHTLQMADGAIRAGYPVHFLTGHAMKAQLESRRYPVSITLTDNGVMAPRKWESLSGQLAMLFDYLGRLRGTFAHLSEITPDDCAYLNTDFWWDSRPGIFCRAKRKLMILGMDCPTLSEIIFQSRPDVKSIRLPSIHYWLSQNLALRLFRRCKNKKLLYVHEAMKPRLLKMGYRESELVYISNGIDVRQADSVPEQEKVYDAVWTGRVHKQKGIDDLLATLVFLAAKIENFRAVIIGSAKKTLAPQVEALGIGDKVHFSGYVSEEEKFRLLKSSRVFLMPSHYECWGIVIGEALACGVPVVAYDVWAYRPIFGDFVRYAPCFDLQAFQDECLAQIQKLRRGENYLNEMNLEALKTEHSWEEAQRKFSAAVASLG
ncbi:MAG: glycosyltransferase [Verrucomicrobiota bacterium]